ncbi:MAG: hypothetical protein IKI31_00565 [Treponema sp.]|nr:hypothetical protein [Treponema sp.]
MKNKLLTFFLFILLNTALHAAGFFNGIAGIKMDTNFTKSVSFQSFFAGQFNFTPNIIMRAEASLNTPNIASEHFFDSWVGAGFLSLFKIDEISVSFRQHFFGGQNYVGLYVGQYEPLGSDVFLRRHFNTPRIASKITDSWLGLSGSVIYPRFKAGISDVIHFNSKPIAIGLYTYYDTNQTRKYNSETHLFESNDKEQEHGISTDFRFACAYDKFYLDAILGLQTNIKWWNKEADYFMRIDDINLQTGVTMLVGNTYTPFSFFMQAGMYHMKLNASKIRDKNIDFTQWMDDSFYVLLEPRMKIRNFGMDISLFAFPETTKARLFVVKGNMGVNINLYGNAGYLGKADTTFGCHAAFSSNKTPSTLFTSPEDLFEKFFSDYDIFAAPYMNMKIHTGDFYTMMKFHINKFIAGGAALNEAFELHVGYKAHF